MSKAKARIAAARSQAERAGRRLPRQLRKPPRQAYPSGLELEYARTIQRATRAWYAEAIAEVLALYPRLVELSAIARRHDADDVRLDGWADELETLMGMLVGRWSRQVASLLPLVNQLARRLADFNFVEIQSQFRSVLGVDVLGAEPWLADELRAYGTENARLIRNIGEDAAARVERLVADGVRSGASTKAIKVALRDALGIGDRRARLIARDQIGKLNGNLTRERQTRVGVDTYRWRTVGDRRVRHSHRGREGNVYRWDDPPGDGHPGQPVQCRCIAEPVLDEFADLMPRRSAPDWEAIGKPPTERRRWGSEFGEPTEGERVPGRSPARTEVIIRTRQP